MSVRQTRSTGHYGRMFPPAATAPTEQYLNKLEVLGRAMLEPGHSVSADCAPTLSPAGYTYFAQLVDHDLSFDRTPLAEARAFEPEEIPNGRTPWLDLDHVYGGGPERSPQLYEGAGGAERFRLAGSADLPRGEVYKLIGDQSLTLRDRDFRDLENAIILQLRILFMRLHNLAIEQQLSCGIGIVDAANGTRFKKAARLVRWEYQRLVRRDLLPHIVDRTVLARIQADGPTFGWRDGFFIPVEFSTAAFRFGHSAVRPSYRMNANARVSLGELLAPALATEAIPERMVVKWENFFPLSGHRPAPMMAIDTRITPDLGELTRYTARIVGPPELTVRTLQRGAWMRLPSGQDVARALGLPALTPEQLTGAASTRDSTPDQSGRVLAEVGLVDDTPLFYYLLREAEVPPSCGARLGVVGSRIVAETIEAAFRFDADSYWHVPGGWSPPRWEFPSGKSRHIESMSDVIEVLGH